MMHTKIYFYIIILFFFSFYLSGCDYRNYIYNSVSKASIYCGAIMLIKEDGRRVQAVDPLNYYSRKTDKE